MPEQQWALVRDYMDAGIDDKQSWLGTFVASEFETPEDWDAMRASEQLEIDSAVSALCELIRQLDAGLGLS